MKGVGMRNRLFLILLALVIFAGGVLSARFFTGGGEDTWICEAGVWVRHGNPAAPEPTQGCGENAAMMDSADVSDELTDEQDQTLGGDRDEHGCIGSAGYTWCEEKDKCLRTWEEPCVPESVDTDVISREIKTQIVQKHGQTASIMVVTVSRVEGDYAQGGAKAQDAGGGMWFAAKSGASWKLVWDGNGIITCKDIQGYDFPVSMIPECYDEATGQSVSR